MKRQSVRRLIHHLLIAAGLSPGWMTISAVDAQSPTEIPVQSVSPKPGSHMAFDFGALWTMSDGKMLRIDATDNSIVEIPVPGSEDALMLMELNRYRGIATGEGAVWLPDMASSSIMKVDPEKHKVVLTITTDIFGSTGSIGVGEGAVWVVTFDNHDKTLTRYSAPSGVLEAKVALPQASKEVLVAFGSVWVTAATRPELYRIDPKTNQVVDTIPIHAATHLVAADDKGSIWLGFDTDAIIQRLDGYTGQVIATIETGAGDMESDGDLTSGGGYIWMINRGSIIARVDPTTNSAKGTFRPPPEASMGRRLRVGSNSLWLSGNAIYRATLPE